MYRFCFYLIKRTAMELINNIQADIMEHLARFSYLSVSQLQRLTGKSLPYIREQLAILRKKYVKSYHVEITAKVRAENIYYLTHAGKEILLQHEKVFAGDIKLPIGTPLVIRDYNHRKNFIEVHIALYQFLRSQGIYLETFLCYFDKQGNVRKDNNLESKTQISLGGDQWYIPDGIMVSEYNEIRKLWLLELYNGKDTVRVIQQLAKHSKVISLGTASKKFDIQASPFVLSVFEHDGSKQAVIKRLHQYEKFTPVAHLFFFASLADVLQNTGTAWHDIHSNLLVFT